jgi:TPR repeat protein
MDLSEALRWYEKAARQGDAEAAAELRHYLRLQEQERQSAGQYQT